MLDQVCAEKIAEENDIVSVAVNCLNEIRVLLVGISSRKGEAELVVLELLGRNTA